MEDFTNRSLMTYVVTMLVVSTMQITGTDIRTDSIVPEAPPELSEP